MDRRTDYPLPAADVNADPPGHKFRQSFWRWLIISIIVAPLAYTLIITLLTLVVNGRKPFADLSYWVLTGTGWLAIDLLLIPGLLIYVHVWTIRVSPTTLSGFNAWGVFVAVTWDSIHSVKPWRVPFLPALRVYSTDTRSVIWLPLFLTNYPEFARRVAEYAGPGHPLTGPVLSRLDPEES